MLHTPPARPCLTSVLARRLPGHRSCLIPPCLLVGAAMLAGGMPSPAAAAPPPPSNTPAAKTPAKIYEITRVPLFFYRKASVIRQILQGIIDAENTEEISSENTQVSLKGMKVYTAGNSSAASGGAEGSVSSVTSPADVDESVLILYGTHAQVRRARQFIASLDLPVPGVRLQMWGFQISSRDPKRMKDATQAVYRHIDEARSAVRELNQDMQFLAAKDLPPDPAFRQLLADTPPGGLGYTGALDDDRPQSLSDILLRLVAAEPEADAAFANDLYKKLGYTDSAADLEKRPGHENIFAWKYRDILGTNPVPFSHMFIPRGLLHQSVAGEAPWKPDQDGTTRIYNRQGRRSVLDFTYQYADFIERPNEFSPYYLQQTSDVLTYRLQMAVDALNQDVGDLIIQPTLARISEELAGTQDVEYAEVGRVEVATLNNVPTTVEGTAVHAFDSLPPLTLGDVAKNVTAGAPPTFLGSESLRLIAAAGQNTTVWKDLADNISLEVTPNVLRNATSAELMIHLTVGDPQAGTRSADMPALSYISKHEVRDRVYLNALDIFDLSTFSSQATLTGGRAYTPIVGPAWHGVFGDVPVLGDLFSWKKNPKTVYSQSILFASTVITPTAMEMALLYPHSGTAHWDPSGLYTKVEGYKYR